MGIHFRPMICVLMIFLAALSLLAGDQATERSIRVGIYQMPPLALIDSSGNCSGVIVEITNFIAEQEHWKVQYIPGTWPECVERLRDGSVDMMCLIADRPDRRQWAVFNTEPVFLDWGQIWVPPGSKIRDLYDLKGKTVVGVKEDVFSTEFRLMVENASIDVNFMDLPGYQPLMDMIRTGIPDAVVLNRIFQPEPYNVDIEKSNIIFSPIPIHYGFPRNGSLNADLIPRIDNHLIQMKRSTSSVYSRAFEKCLEDTTRSRRQMYLILTGCGLAGLLGAIFVYRSLKRRRIERDRILEAKTRQIDELADKHSIVEKQFQRLFDTINDGVVVCNLSIDGVLSQIDLVNRQACLIFGRTEDQMRKLDPKMLIADEERYRIPELIKQLQSRHAVLFQITVETMDRSAGTVEIHANLIEVNGMWKIMAVIRDVSERLLLEKKERIRLSQLEEQFRQRTMEIEEMSREVNLLAGTVSHDLQGPLRTIQDSMERVQRKLTIEDTDLRGEFDRVIFQIQKINNLIRGILEYSRLSRGELELTPLGLSQICSEVLLHIDEMIRNQKADVIIERPMPRVIGHSNTLFRVIQNLVINAIKFVEPGKRPKVILRAESREDVVRLWVIDNGIGIAPEYHDRIFNVFQRLHGSDEYPGNGLGLAIVKRGMQRMKGSIGLISEIGEGSRFWIELDADSSDS